MASHADVLCGIASDLEARKGEFPQLAEFSATAHCNRETLIIRYAYHTHAPTGRGGWSSAVPNPDDDGIWMYIDFHDPASMAQIHTQPVVPSRHYRDKKLMVLLLEGDKTTSVGSALEEILKARGIEAGPPK